MLDTLFENGGRKLWLVVFGVLLAVLNEALGIGISKETIQMILIAVIGGSGTIALEDGLRAAFGPKEPEWPTARDLADLLADDEKEETDAKD